MVTMSLERKPTLKERLSGALKIGASKAKYIIKETPAKTRRAYEASQRSYNTALDKYEAALEKAEKSKKEAKHQESRLTTLLKRTKKLARQRPKKRRAKRHAKRR